MSQIKEINEDECSFTLPIILYDNECHLCIRFMESFKRIPETKNYSFIPFKMKKFFSAFPQLDEKSATKHFTL